MPSRHVVPRLLSHAIPRVPFPGGKRRAAEQLVGLPDETPDERQDASDRIDVHSVGSTADRWLEGRVALAKTLMDVGERLFLEPRFVFVIPVKAFHHSVVVFFVTGGRGLCTGCVVNPHDFDLNIG